MNPDTAHRMDDDKPEALNCKECGQHTTVFTREDGSRECDSCGASVPMTAPKLTEAQRTVLTRLSDGKLQSGKVFAGLGLTEDECLALLDNGLINIMARPQAVYITEAGRKAVER